MHCKLRILATAAVVASVSLSSMARAESAAKPEKPDDVIELSEFTVKETSDHGYIASEAVTGPRLATKIADLPYPITVVTSEFLRDFDVFDFSSAVNGLAASVSGASDEGSVTIRGTSTN